MDESAHRVELTVQLDPLSEPIGGSITDVDGRRRCFAGWLELMEILDGARRHHLDPADTPQRRGGTR
jgi:hypothetical protein